MAIHLFIEIVFFYMQIYWIFLGAKQPRQINILPNFFHIKALLRISLLLNAFFLILMKSDDPKCLIISNFSPLQDFAKRKLSCVVEGLRSYLIRLSLVYPRTRRRASWSRTSRPTTSLPCMLAINRTYKSSGFGGIDPNYPCIADLSRSHSNRPLHIYL